MWWKKRWRSSGEGKVLKAGQNEARGTVATSKAVWSFYHQYMDQWQLSLWAPNPTSVLVTLWCPCRECCGCTAPILEINFKRWRSDNMDLLWRDSKHVRRATVLSIQYRGPSTEVRKPLHLHEWQSSVTRILTDVFQLNSNRLLAFLQPAVGQQSLCYQQTAESTAQGWTFYYRLTFPKIPLTPCASHRRDCLVIPKTLTPFFPSMFFPRLEEMQSPVSFTSSSYNTPRPGGISISPSGSGNTATSPAKEEKEKKKLEDLDSFWCLLQEQIWSCYHPH